MLESARAGERALVLDALARRNAGVVVVLDGAHLGHEIGGRHDFVGRPPAGHHQLDVLRLVGEEALAYDPNPDDSERQRVLRAAASCPVQAIILEVDPPADRDTQ